MWIYIKLNKKNKGIYKEYFNEKVNDIKRNNSIIKLKMNSKQAKISFNTGE